MRVSSYVTLSYLMSILQYQGDYSLVHYGNNFPSFLIYEKLRKYWPHCTRHCAIPSTYGGMLIHFVAYWGISYCTIHLILYRLMLRYTDSCCRVPTHIFVQRFKSPVPIYIICNLSIVYWFATQWFTGSSTIFVTSA